VVLEINLASALVVMHLNHTTAVCCSVSGVFFGISCPESPGF